MFRGILRVAGMAIGLILGYIISVTLIGHLYKIYARRFQGRISNEDEQWDFGEAVFGIGALGLAIFVIIAAATGNYLENPTLIVTFFDYLAQLIFLVIVTPVLFLIPISFMLFILFPEG